MVIEGCAAHSVRPSIISFLADSPIVQAICPENLVQDITMLEIGKTFQF